MLYLCITEGETTRFPLFYAPKMPKTTSKVVKTRSDVVKNTSDVVFRKSDVVNFSTDFGAKTSDFVAKKLIIVKTLYFLIFVNLLKFVNNFGLEYLCEYARNIHFEQAVSAPDSGHFGVLRFWCECLLLSGMFAAQGGGLEVNKCL